MTEIKYRERLLSTINQAAEVLLTADERNINNALTTGMELVGLCLDVDRVQIWRNEIVDGELHFVMRYEWLSETGRNRREVPIGLRGAYSDRPDWLEMFLRGDYMNTPIEKLQPRDADFLGFYEMVSIVNYPLFLNKEFIGFFSIDDCINVRTFTDDEMKMIASAGMMFASIFLRMEQARVIAESQSVLLHREKLLSTMNQVASVLLAVTNSSGYQAALRQGLEMIGRCLDADRVQLWRASTQTDGVTITLDSQWLSAIGLGRPQSARVQKALFGNFPAWEESLLNGKSFNGPVSSLPKAERKFIDPLGVIKSAVVIPIFLQANLWGFFVTDDCIHERTLENDEMDILRSASLMIASTGHRVQQAEIINEANQRAIQLFNATPLMIEYWNDDYVVIDCNQATLDFYGYKSKEEYNNAFVDPDVFKLHILNNWYTNIGITFELGSRSFEIKERKLNGEPVFLEVQGIRMKLDDIDTVVTYSRDITQIKELQEERRRIEIVEESNRAKSRFLARMSHEIRTPITAVLGISEIQLQNSDLPVQVEDSFVKIYNSASLLLGIVNDILDLSKIEAGKMTIAQEEYEVASMINDVVSLRLAHLDEKDIKFNLYVDEKLPAYLIGDVLRIEQIMNNLLSNAFKYTESGTVEMSVSALKAEAGYVTLVLTISDTGMGMSAKQIEAIYDDYTRFHEQEQSSGTGLGMPIVYSLSGLMDAKIDLESKVGEGTKVVIQLPQKIAGRKILGKKAASRLQRFEESLQISPKKFKFVPEPMPYGKVLVVDDIEANLYVTQGLLAFYNLQVDTASSGYEAIDKIKAGNVYDMIFLDHMMPKLSGTETMRELRKLGYSNPIIAFTANALIGQKEEYIKDGFDGFISKPIQTKLLNSVLNEHIRDKQPPEVLESARASAKKIEHENIDNYQNNAELMKKLRKDFVRGQKDAMAEINEALAKSDIENARILSHSLKGLAGLIQEDRLMQAAEIVEQAILNEENPTKESLELLERELTAVLKSIGKPEKELIVVNEPDEKAMELLDKLRPLLESYNAECMDFLDELKALPETAILVRQIEQIEFNEALKSLEILADIFNRER